MFSYRSLGTRVSLPQHHRRRSPVCRWTQRIPETPVYVRILRTNVQTSGRRSEYFGYKYGYSGHSVRTSRTQTRDSGIGRDTLKKMFLSGLCGSQVFAYKYAIISLNIHVIYLHPQIILSCMPQNNTQSSISHV